MKTDAQPVPKVVLDTHIVLDLWLYRNPDTFELLTALAQHKLSWFATLPMRDELARVLTYPHITERRLREHIHTDSILQRFDAHVFLQPVAPKAPCVCKDPDDQKFIDLAVAHHARLISKDKHVLRLTHRLTRLSVQVSRGF